MSTTTDPGNKSPDEIERELSEERARLSRTADELQDRLSVGSLIDEVMSRGGNQGSEFAKNFGRTVRDNPLPVALIGVGLAWLMAGGQDATDRRDGALGRFSGDGDDYDERGGYASMSGYRSRYVGGGEPRSGISRSGVDWDRDESEESYGEKAGNAARSARDGVAGATSSAASGVSSAASSVAGGASDAAGYVGDRARSAGRSISRASDEAAWRARHYGRRGADGFERMMDEQPLVVGALALALGAAIGGLAPNSRAENRLMGEHAERMRGEAADVMAEEGAKARRVAEAAADEAGRMADEAAHKTDDETPDGRSMVEKAEDRAKDAASRIAGAAEDEASRQDLGSSVSSDRT